MVESLAERHAMLAEIRISNLVQILPPNVEQAFYRVGQESIENVSIHSSAKKMFFSLAEEDGVVSMEIRDDGVGFEPQNQHGKGHYGLQGMQERATSIGADLDVLSQPGVGTTIKLSWERFV